MTQKWIIFSLLFGVTLSAYAKPYPLPGKPFFSPKESTPGDSKAAPNDHAKKMGKPKKVIFKKSLRSGNLPSFYLAKLHQGFVAASGSLLLPQGEIEKKLKGLIGGDELLARIDQTLNVTGSSPRKIRAIVIGRKLNGAILLGETRMNPDLPEEILVEFSQIREESGKVLYDFAAIGQPILRSEVGVMGEHHSDDTGFFIGEVLSYGAAAYADATLDRAKDSDGIVREQDTVANAAKKGAIAGLSRTAERAAERARSTPGYTTLEGPVFIRVMVNETPRISL